MKLLVFRQRCRVSTSDDRERDREREKEVERERERWREREREKERARESIKKSVFAFLCMRLRSISRQPKNTGSMMYYRPLL